MHPVLEAVLADLPGLGILAACYGVLIAIAETWARLGKPNPEHTRKLVHIGGGAACLFIPFLLRSGWTVLAMALSMSALFVVGRKALHSLHKVERSSRGSEYYPLAIFLVFYLARDTPAIYVSSILVLAVADAFAALVGTRYGSIHYTVQDESKSLEGSLAFLVVAFLAIHLPLLLMTDLPRETTVLAALLVGLLVTGFECVALKGADNLLVPVGACLILEKVTLLPEQVLVYQNVGLVAISAMVGVAVWQIRSINVGGAIVVIMFGFATWSLGSILWAIPVLAGFVMYLLSWVWGPLPEEYLATARVRLIYRALTPPFAVVVIANLTGDDAFWFGPYLGMSVAVVTFSLWNHVLWTWSPAGARRYGAAVALGGIAFVVGALIPYFALAGDPPLLALAAIGAVALVGAVVNAWAVTVDSETESSQLWNKRRMFL
ncbi:hypothetical protein OAX78_04700, partial [Planctomycetota bacterium]|nr:hypothetical protein [Planctomycetota bacterium]